MSGERRDRMHECEDVTADGWCLCRRDGLVEWALDEIRTNRAILRELRLILTDIVNRGHVDRAVAARETLRVIDGLEVLHGRRTP